MSQSQRKYQGGQCKFPAKQCNKDNINRETRFVTNPKSNIFKSVLSKGPRSSRSTSECFAYDLSPGELHFGNITTQAMKKVPDTERQLLENGQRSAYLERRYEHMPEVKYNFPEATSWRIGWMHNNKLRTIHSCLN